MSHAIPSQLVDIADLLDLQANALSIEGQNDAAKTVKTNGAIINHDLYNVQVHQIKRSFFDSSSSPFTEDVSQNHQAALSFDKAIEASCAGAINKEECLTKAHVNVARAGHKAPTPIDDKVPHAIHKSETPVTHHKGEHARRMLESTNLPEVIFLSQGVDEDQAIEYRRQNRQSHQRRLPPSGSYEPANDFDYDPINISLKRDEEAMNVREATPREVYDTQVPGALYIALGDDHFQSIEMRRLHASDLKDKKPSVSESKSHADPVLDQTPAKHVERSAPKQVDGPATKAEESKSHADAIFDHTPAKDKEIPSSHKERSAPKQVDGPSTKAKEAPKEAHQLASKPKTVIGTILSGLKRVRTKLFGRSPVPSAVSAAEHNPTGPNELPSDKVGVMKDRDINPSLVERASKVPAVGEGSNVGTQGSVASGDASVKPQGIEASIDNSQAHENIHVSPGEAEHKVESSPMDVHDSALQHIPQDNTIGNAESGPIKALDKGAHEYYPEQGFDAVGEELEKGGKVAQAGGNGVKAVSQYYRSIHMSMPIASQIGDSAKYQFDVFGGGCKYHCEDVIGAVPN